LNRASASCVGRASARAAVPPRRWPWARPTTHDVVGIHVWVQLLGCGDERPGGDDGSGGGGTARPGAAAAAAHRARRRPS
jgi:hypothetical protein